MTDDASARTYRSPLRDEQARRTRDLILDALIELLADRRSDDITTREIAERSGVSQPTIYRHFPDRTALLRGISARVGELIGERWWTSPTLETIDDIGPRFEALFEVSDEFAVEVRAEALLNADPRWYSLRPSNTPPASSTWSPTPFRISTGVAKRRSPACCAASGHHSPGCACARSSVCPASSRAHCCAGPSTP